MSHQYLPVEGDQNRTNDPTKLSRARSGSLSLNRQRQQIARPLPPTPGRIKTASTDLKDDYRSVTNSRRSSYQPLPPPRRKGSSLLTSSLSLFSVGSTSPHPSPTWEATLRLRVIEAKVKAGSNTIIDMSNIGDESFFASVGQQKTGWSTSGSCKKGNPFWYEELVIDLHQHQRELIKLELYCKRLLRSAHIGTLHFDIHALAKDGSTNEGWFPLIHPASATAASTSIVHKSETRHLEHSSWQQRRGTGSHNTLMPRSEELKSENHFLVPRKSINLGKAKAKLQRKAESAPTSPSKNRHTLHSAMTTSPSTISNPNTVKPAPQRAHPKSNSLPVPKDAPGVPGGVHIAVFQPGHHFTRTTCLKNEGVLTCGICQKLIILDPDESDKRKNKTTTKGNYTQNNGVRTTFKSFVSQSHISCVSCGFPCHIGCHLTKPTSCGHAGFDMRVSYSLTLDPILQLSEYSSDFRNFLYHPEEYWIYLVSDGRPSVIEPKRPEDRTELASVLVEMHTALGDLIPFLQNALRAEVDASNWNHDSLGGTTTTAFRGNSTAIKCNDYLFKYMGMDWLRKALGSTIKELVNANPKEISTDSFFLGIVERTLSRIRASTPSIPPAIRAVMGHLQGLVRQRMDLPNNCFSESDETSPGVHGQQEDMPAIMVGSFVFLRFFSAALLGPKLWQLVAAVPDDRIHLFTRLAKVLQQTANLIPFQRDSKDAQLAHSFNDLLAIEIPLLRNWINSTFVEVTDLKSLDAAQNADPHHRSLPAKLARTRRSSTHSMPRSPSVASCDDKEGISVARKASAVHRILHRIILANTTSSVPPCDASESPTLAESSEQISRLRAAVMLAQAEKERTACTNPWFS